VGCDATWAATRRGLRRDVGCERGAVNVVCDAAWAASVGPPRACVRLPAMWGYRQCGARPCDSGAGPCDVGLRRDVGPLASVGPRAWGGPCDSGAPATDGRGAPAGNVGWAIWGGSKAGLRLICAVLCGKLGAKGPIQFIIDQMLFLTIHSVEKKPSKKKKTG
jgi:hypothetical protein